MLKSKTAQSMLSIRPIKVNKDVTFNKVFIDFKKAKTKQRRKQSRNIALVPSYYNSIVLSRKHSNNNHFKAYTLSLNAVSSTPQLEINTTKKNHKKTNTVIDKRSFLNQPLSLLPRVNDSSLNQREKKGLSHSTSKCILPKTNQLKKVKRFCPLSLQKHPLILKKELFSIEFDNKELKRAKDKQDNDCHVFTLLSKGYNRNRDKDKALIFNTKYDKIQKSDGNYMYVKGTLTKESTIPPVKVEVKDDLLSEVINRRIKQTEDNTMHRTKSLVSFKKKKAKDNSNNNQKKETMPSIADIKSQNEKKFNDYIKSVNSKYINSIKTSSKNIALLKLTMFDVLQDAKDDYDNQMNRLEKSSNEPDPKE